MFKVGDIVVGNDKSDREYRITAKKNNFEGEVVRINGDLIELKTLKSDDPEYFTETFKVDPEYFELKETLKDKSEFI